jgi:hypothetical protein
MRSQPGLLSAMMNLMPWRRRTDRPPMSPTAQPAPDSALLHIAAAREPGLVLVHALDGFLSAGQAGHIASRHLLGSHGSHGDVVATFDVDALYDYRARRPPLAFDEDHYAGYEAPQLDVRRLVDAAGTPYLLLAGPEPDYRWEAFIGAVGRLVDELDVRLVVGLGAVPMGVPHTRPVVVTAHATRPELVDRPNVWSGRLTVPASAQALLELRLGERGHDAMGYVAHVPHYVSGVEYPAASVTLLEAAGAAAGLTFDLDALREAARLTVDEIDRQVAEQDGAEVLDALEKQYDAFSRGAAQSMLARDEELPSADELGQQFEQFLAGLDRREGSG